MGKMQRRMGITSEHDAGDWKKGGEKNWQDFVAEPAKPNIPGRQKNRRTRVSKQMMKRRNLETKTS